jgi:DNA-binding response OmpR family regulator
VRKLLLGSERLQRTDCRLRRRGLELFKQNPVQLVISDHFLTGRSGVEIAREMKQLKPEVPILIMSAAMEKPDGLEFADGFLEKGEATTILLATIARLLGSHTSS